MPILKSSIGKGIGKSITLKESNRILNKVSFKPKPSTLGLPDQPTEAANDPKDIRTLIVSPPGWGKTEFFMSNPDCLLLACEEGHKFTQGNKIIIDAWDGILSNGGKEPYTTGTGTKLVWHNSFVGAVASLQKTDRFSMIFIDTIDALVKMLLDYGLGKRHIEHASDGGDYGKGWDIIQNSPFRKQLNILLKSGRGIGASTHEQAENKNFKSGTRAKKETTLPSGIYRQIYAQFDLILHGIFGKSRKGVKTRDRILISEGSEDILAKNRGGLLPPAFIVPRKFEERWKQFEEFFTKPKSKDLAFAEYEKAGYSLDD